MNNNWYRDFQKMLDEAASATNEGIMDIFKTKEYTGDKTPNKVTPKKSNTGEEFGKLFVQFIYYKSQPNRVKIMYRHYDDPTQWSEYGYISLDDPSQYKAAIQKWVSARLAANVQVQYKPISIQP